MPIWLDEPDDNSIELPWVEAYVRENGASGTPLMVLLASVRIKGIMICTAEWRAYLFKGSKSYDNLMQALPNYVEFKGGLPKLIAVATEAGKIKIGLETESPATCNWTKEGNDYAQVDNNPKKRGTVRNLPANPLLPPSLEANKPSK